LDQPCQAIYMDENRQVTKAAGVIGLATLLSRIMGFIRDMVTAWFFGAGFLTDAFFVAFRIPNILRRLLAEGSLSIAFVPVFTEAIANNGKEEAFQMARSAVRLLSIILVAVTVIGILAAPFIVRLMAPGFEGEKFTLTLLLTRIMFPYVFFICLVALCMGILNVLGHFAAPALSPVLLNLSIIGAVFLISPHLDQPVFGLAFGVLIGGALQLCLQIPFLIHKCFFFWKKAPLFHPGLKKMFQMMGPAVFGAAVHQINIFIGTLLASLLPEGSVSFLYYADRLVEFPLGIFAISTSVAALPSLARQASDKNMPALKNTFAHAMNFTLFITFPAMVGLMVLTRPIVTLLFERGAFDPQSTDMTVYALMCYAAGLWAFAAVRVIVSTFYALLDTQTPVKMATVSIIVNIILSLSLMGPMKHGGLALATSLSSMLNVFLLLWALRGKIGAIGLKKIIESVLKSVVCSFIMGCCLWWMLGALNIYKTSDTLNLLWRLGLLISAGIFVYVLSAAVLKCRELSDIFDMLKIR
jgi:putative peptidoglycan lipid II flippase